MINIVINHHGKVAQGGHYTCDVFCNGKEWIRFDDTSVTPVNLDAVLGEEKDRQPYILFYQLDK
jgi:ubiquitin C-terminal hydrolase